MDQLKLNFTDVILTQAQGLRIQIARYRLVYTKLKDYNAFVHYDTLRNKQLSADVEAAYTKHQEKLQAVLDRLVELERALDDDPGLSALDVIRKSLEELSVATVRMVDHHLKTSRTELDVVPSNPHAFLPIALSPSDTSISATTPFSVAPSINVPIWPFLEYGTERSESWPSESPREAKEANSSEASRVYAASDLHTNVCQQHTNTVTPSSERSSALLYVFLDFYDFFSV